MSPEIEAAKKIIEEKIRKGQQSTEILPNSEISNERFAVNTIISLILVTIFTVIYNTASYDGLRFMQFVYLFLLTHIILDVRFLTRTLFKLSMFM